MVHVHTPAPKTPRVARVPRAPSSSPAISLNLPPPNPFPPGVIPGSPLTDKNRPYVFSTPVMSTPAHAKSPQPQDDNEVFPGDDKFVELLSRVYEVPGATDASGNPVYDVLPPAAAQEEGEPDSQQASQDLLQTTPQDVFETAAPPVLSAIDPNNAQTLEHWPNPATTFLFDNAACPLADVGKQYWLTFNGHHAGVFDNKALLDAEMVGVKGIKHNEPQTLADAFELWKRACLTGAVHYFKPISPHSVLPRIVARPSVVVEDHVDVDMVAKLARRNELITDIFRARVAEHRMAVDPPVENCRPSGTSMDAAEERPVDVFGSQPILLSPFSISKGKEPAFAHSRTPSNSSAGAASQFSTSSDTLVTNVAYGPTPTNSMRGSNPDTPCSSPPSFAERFPTVSPPLWWAVLAGRKPGVYDSEQDVMDAHGGVSGGRIVCFTTMIEASKAYANAVIAGEIEKKV